MGAYWSSDIRENVHLGFNYSYNQGDVKYDECDRLVVHEYRALINIYLHVTYMMVRKWLIDASSASTWASVNMTWLYNATHLSGQKNTYTIQVRILLSELDVRIYGKCLLKWRDLTFIRHLLISMSPKLWVEFWKCVIYALYQISW